MLIWVNGAFGAGKTQTTFELHRRLPGSLVADPERIGFAMHRMLPPHVRDDFQDLPQWRSAVVDTLVLADRTNTGPVLVPMTLVDPGYFDQIMAGLADAGAQVAHFSLIVSPGLLRARLRNRVWSRLGRFVGGNETFALSHVQRCVSALATEQFATHIDNDGRPLDEVVEDIAGRAGLTLELPRQTSARRRVDRLRVQVRHLRV